MDLDERLNRLAARAIRLSGILYRSSAPQYANSSDLLTGEGSRRFGGRWNPIGVAAVYGSFTPQTAMAETLAFANYYQLPVHVSMPRTFVAIEFDLGAVLDLTTGRNRQSLGISEQRLLECDWRREAERGDVPLTQAVGRSAHQAGLEGILVRSAADPTGRNLVVFVENLHPESSLKVVSVDQLGTP